MKSAIALFGLVAALTAPALAQNRQPAHASEWVRTAGAQVRLIAPAVSNPDPEAWQVAGIEIRLEPGAKTYWRSPGDTGVPPTVDFGNSQSLRDLTLDFPAPVGFDDGAGGTAIGYRETQIFPVRYRMEPPPAAPPASGGGFFSRKVEPPPPPPPPKLAAAVEFGVCVKNMCMPAQASLSLPIGSGVLEAALGDRLTAAQARVPVRRKIGEAGAIGITAVQARRQGDTLDIDVAARVGNDLGNAAVFIEMRETLAATIQGAPIGGSAVFRAKGRLTSDPRLGEARITLVTASGAIDVVLDLDAAAKRP